MRLQGSFNIANTIAILLGLLAINTILGSYYFISQSSESTFEKNMGIFNSLQHLDQQWSVAILETRSYTLQDFDQLANYIIKIRKKLTILNQYGMLNNNQVGARTVNQYQIYKNSLEVKNESVEHYKSQQAILRNAVRYLPTVRTELQSVLSDTNKQQRQNINELVNSANLLIKQYLLSSVENDANLAKQKLTLLEQKISNQPIRIKKNLKRYLTHTNIILQYNPQVKQTLETAMSIDIGKLSNNVVHEYTLFQYEVKEYIQQLQQVMLSASIVLLIIVFWFLRRLMKSRTETIVADEENQETHEQLLQAEVQMGQVNKNMLQIERRAASGQLALGTFKQLQNITPPFSQNMHFLQQMKMDETLSSYQEGLGESITNINKLLENIDELDNLINSQNNRDKKTLFDFNIVIQKALGVVSFEMGETVTFTEQIGDIPKIQACPVDIFQIALKLFRQAAKVAQRDHQDIFLKTWIRDEAIHMYITPTAYYDLETLYASDDFATLQELIAQNHSTLKLTAKEKNKNGMFWFSLPYK